MPMLRGFGRLFLPVAAAGMGAGWVQPLSNDCLAREATAAARPGSDEPPAGLTHGEWSQIRRSIRESEYHASPAATPGEAPALQAPNRQQSYSTTFRPEGIEIVPAGASWRLGLSVTGYGYEGDVRALEPVVPRAVKERVEYRRGAVTEWYLNRPGGLEQGFELAEPPSRRDEPLVVAMAVRGDLDVSAHGDGVSFGRRSGGTLVRYADLEAWDAEGRPLRSRLESSGREVRLVVEAQAARFPVTVDPTFVHEAQLFGHGDPIGQTVTRFGIAVSVSGDTVLVGADTEDTPAGVNAGAAYVFVRSGTTWTLQQRLLAADGAADDRFGISVSVSGDTAVVGAFADDTPPLAEGAVNGGSAYVFVRSGTSWTQQQKLLPSILGSGAFFGYAVAVSGNTAVVGAIFDDAPGVADVGAAYVFVRSGTTWTEQQRLLASDGIANDYFGSSVSISGNTAVVGAPVAGNANAGAAYVFVRSGATWTEEQKLLASDMAPEDQFGQSVSISGDTVVVGAYFDANPGGVDAGAAYVFVRSGTTWTEEQKLLASDGAPGDQFGQSVSISADTVVVGAYGGDAPAGLDAGSAYVFVRAGTTWTQQQKLLASDGQPDAEFGFSVSVSGDTLVAGAPSDANPGFGTGSAYVFERAGTTWSQEQKLLASDSAAADGFGSSVSVSGDTAVVGALFDATPGAFAGSAYVFVRSGTTWTEQQKLLASDGAAGDNFGASVSISGDTLIVGAPLNDTAGGGDAGAAYVFVRSGTTWTEQQVLVASDGQPSDLFGWSVSLSGDTAVVGAYQDDTTFGAEAGSAYVFVRSGTAWTQQQQLLPTSGAATEYFGHSVALSGDTVIVGSPLADAAGGSIADAGAVVVFVRSGTTWTQQQRIEASDPAASDDFGYAVSISGDTAAVGSPFDDTPGFETGSVYVLVRTGTAWSEQQKLVASDGGDADQFGASLSLSGDTLAIGALGDDTAAGAAAGSTYIFVRSGSAWSQQQKLLAPDAAPIDLFGYSVALSGDTVLVGATADDTPGIADAGSAHVFRGLTTGDLAVTKTDGQTTAAPGAPLTYTIVASNAGPGVVTGASVTDVLPAALLGPTWTCSATPGSSCTPSGSGDVDDIVNLAVGGTATYLVTGTVASGATGTLTNAASVAPPAGVPDPNPANNSAADVDVLAPEADLVATKTDGQGTAVPGQPVTYTITAANAGPSDVAGATVTDTVPATLLGAMWTCTASAGSSCAPSGSGNINDTVDLLAGGTATYTLTATLDPAATGMLVNTVAVAAPGGTPDPNAANNSATDTDTLVPAGLVIEGELVHGYRRQHDLAALPGPAPDEDVFLILQRPHASYEILLDGASGDLGSGSGPLLERLGSDGATVIQGSSPAGAGGSRSLRFMNDLDTSMTNEFVRVRSAGCTTDCDAADVYRLSARETTGFIPRFNNSGSQVTVLVLQNLGGEAVDVDVRFWSGPGAPLGGPSIQTLGPRASYVLNTSAIAPGSSGSITVANTGRYGQLTGKAVAVEPATGFTFDTALAPRPR